MTTPNNGNYKRRDYRCPTCGRLWFRAYLSNGTVVQIRCPKCSMFYVIGRDTVGLFVREDEGAQVARLTT